MTPSNLLPIATQISFEHRRQAKFWVIAWVAFAIAITTFFIAMHRQRLCQNLAISVAEESVQPIREAQQKLTAFHSEGQMLSQQASKAESLQLADTPLALIQSIGKCCQDLGSQIQIDSLRMDEIVGPNGSATKTPTIRKQWIVVGSAEADFLITKLVGLLSNGGVFRKVELESSLAVADRNSAKRTFQIRCQQ